MKLKESELASQQRRLDNIVESIAQGRDSKALGRALADTERRVEGLQEEVVGLQASHERAFEVPPAEWIQERLLKLQEVLEARTEKSALLLRDVLGPIHLEPVEKGEERFYRARTALDTLALIETPLGGSAEEGSSALRKWGRQDSNLRRQSQLVYSQSPLTTRALPREGSRDSRRCRA